MGLIELTQRVKAGSLFVLIICALVIQPLLSMLNLNIGIIALNRGAGYMDVETCHVSRQHLERAEESLWRVVDIGSDPYALLARAYMWHDRPAEAIQCLRRSGLPLSFFVDRAKAYHANGYSACALRELEVLIQFAPRSDLPWYHIGGVLASRGDYEQAQAAYDHAIELNLHGTDSITLSEIHVAKGEVYRTTKAVADAYHEYSQAVTVGLFPMPHREVFALYRQAEMLVWMGRYDEAILPLVKASQIEPDSYHTLSLLGFVATQQGKYSDAERLLMAALELEPDYIWTHLYLADLYAITGDLDEAIDRYLFVLELDPHSRQATEALSLLRQNR